MTGRRVAPMDQADAVQRAMRTLWQGFGVDALMAVGAGLAVLLAGGLDVLSGAFWVALGVLVVKSFLTALASYLQRLRAAPKPITAPADPNLADWHPAPDNRGSLGALAGLAILALIMVTALPASAASVTYPYTAHVQTVGWQGMVGDGAVAGTTGKGLRLEALRFVFPGQQARGHVQNVGWQGWQAGDSTQVGTTGKSLGLEAVQVRSTIPGVKIECQAHVQGLGWMPRVGDGQVCGTTGKGLRLEAVRLWLVQK